MNVTSNSDAVSATYLEGLTLVRRGKVRDIYDLGDSLLIVASDRISAYDVIMNEPVPGKGKILTRISRFWFQAMEDLTKHHVISFDVESFPAPCRPHREILKDRSMWVRKANPLPIECIVRGYLAGTAWEEYQREGSVCGQRLPAGLLEASELPVPLFTPSTKAEAGEHDENISLDRAAELVGKERLEKVSRIALAVYSRARDMARKRGILIADTKFEFGIADGALILIDELLTPDSSRFWPLDDYAPGRSQQSFDKQFLRDYLRSTGWNRHPPAPPLPPHIVEQTRRRYEEALRRLTGEETACLPV